MSLKNKIVMAIVLLVLSSSPMKAQDTCMIWLNQGADCESDEIETTLRARGAMQIIAPNHGNIITRSTVIIFNPNNTNGQILVSQNNNKILESRVQPGINRFVLSADVGKVTVEITNQGWRLTTNLNVVNSIELPIANPDSLYDEIANVEFLIKSEFYGEAYIILERLKLEYPDSYEVWAALTILHLELGNQVLMLESAANAINLLSSDESEKIRYILNLIS